MPLYLYSYRYVDQDLRARFRERHVEYLRRLVAEGRVLLAGPYTSNDGGLVLMRAGDAAEARQLAADDPYTTGGVTGERQLKEWNVVFAADAATALTAE